MHISVSGGRPMGRAKPDWPKILTLVCALTTVCAAAEPSFDKEYAFPFDRVWKACMRTANTEGLPVEHADKESAVLAIDARRYYGVSASPGLWARGAKGANYLGVKLTEIGPDKTRMSLSLKVWAASYKKKAWAERFFAAVEKELKELAELPERPTKEKDSQPESKKEEP